jgi:hypothetical protein
MRTSGPNSAEATHWAEIRADLARIAQNHVLATQLWIAACRARLAHQAPDTPEVTAAAQSAHYCWEPSTDDPDRERELGPHLIALLLRLNGQSPPVCAHPYVSSRSGGRATTRTRTSRVQPEY